MAQLKLAYFSASSSKYILNSLAASWLCQSNPNNTLLFWYKTFFSDYENNKHYAKHLMGCVFYQKHLFYDKHTNLGRPQETNRTVGISCLILQYA